MIDSHSAARMPRRFAHFAAAAAILIALSPAAKAQGLFSFFGGGPSPYDIERQLDAGGYTLTGPMIRRGDVYVADVVIGRNDFERLMIDVDTGRIVERFRVRPPHWRAADQRDWSQGEPDSWGSSAPRPPVDLDVRDTRAEPPVWSRSQIVRGEDAAKPPDQIKKPKPKSPDAKRTSAPPAAVAKATNPPASEKPAEPAATPAVVTPAVVTPPVATPASPPPPSPAAKADAPASVVAAKSPPPAETPDAPPPSKKPKAVNDLPVTPLD
jgi:hypothetical protein